MTAPSIRWSRGGLLPQETRDRINAFAEAHRSISIMVGMAVVAILWIVLPQIPPLTLLQNADPWYDAFANAGVFMLLAMGLNIVVGLTGLLDLGYAAFFAIGSYTYAYSNSPFAQQNLPFFPMLLVGAAVAALFGIALGAPTLRLRGDYLAIMTLGFGEIVPIVFLNLDKWTEGTNGIGGIYRPEDLPILGKFSPITPFSYMIVMLFIVTVAMILIYRLHDSRIGRAWMAIREDELAAAANGINTVVTKLLAFALGATTSGLAGVFNASKLTIVSPDQFSFQVSFTVMAMIIIGGMGNIWGVAAGAFVVYLIQTVALKSVNTLVSPIPPIDLGPIHFDVSQINFLNYQYLLYGIALVLMMMKRPEGLFPSQARRAELHEVKNLEVATAADTAEALGALGEAPGADEVFGEDAGEGVDR
jgi:ABC-type branched-subunit amino acid transport system permease subunit